MISPKHNSLVDDSFQHYPKLVLLFSETSTVQIVSVIYFQTTSHKDNDFGRTLANFHDGEITTKVITWLSIDRFTSKFT